MKEFDERRWFRLGLISLAVVACYGALMRYKIVFDFPWAEQKHLLHAHSHFAFSGWITHFLYTGLVLMLRPYLPAGKAGVYNRLIAANWICAAGMLVAFTWQGYQAVSIGFSTASIAVSVWFAWVFFGDARRLPPRHSGKNWALAGLVFQVVSAAGPFSLAWMMATHRFEQDIYLSSLYYYLHFQYNGWFFFGTTALALTTFQPVGLPLTALFRLFAGAVAGTLFLSLLWLGLPGWLYGLTVASALVQLIAWGGLFRVLRRQVAAAAPGYLLLTASALALTLKFLLQAASAIPSLSQWVFGFRPVVIAYLHLVLLGVYSLFFVGYLLLKGYYAATGWRKGVAVAFLAGVVGNEALLAVQGCGVFFYVPHLNEALLLVALWLAGSTTALVPGILRRH